MLAVSFRIIDLHTASQGLLIQLYQESEEQMDVFEAIHRRHMNASVTQNSIPRQLIEKLLSAAVQAPNHHKVRPWRFVVIAGDGLNRLGEVMAASFAERQPGLPPEALEKTRGLPHRAPLVIAVGVDKPNEPKVLEIENIVGAKTWIVVLQAGVTA